jgi:hypothetical protein
MVVTVTRAGFHSPDASPDNKGYTVTVGVGLFSWLNVGIAETHWQLYSKTANYPWWYDADWFRGDPHNSHSGYVELLPFKGHTMRFTGSLGVGFILGNDAGGGQGSYHGFTGSSYGSFHVNRLLDITGRFTQALVVPEGGAGNFMQTSYGGGIGLRAIPSLLLMVNYDHAIVQRRAVTTASLGLAYLIPQN